MTEELGEEETEQRFKARRKGGGKVSQGSQPGGRRLGRMTSPSAEEVDVGAFSDMSAAKAPSLSAPNTLPEACHSPMKEWGPTERAESKKKK